MKRIEEFQNAIDQLFKGDSRQIIDKFGELSELDSPANNLQISVLEGEFYPSKNEGSESYYEKLFKIIKGIDKILNDNNVRLQAIKKVHTTTLINEKGYGRALELIKYSKKAIIHYESFIKIISENLKAHDDGGLETISSKMLFFDVDLIFRLENTLEDILTEGGEAVIHYILFCINLSLAEIDENLDCSENVIYRISKLKTFLKEKGYNQNKNTKFLVDILIEKCNFLTFKIHLRQERCFKKDIHENSNRKPSVSPNEEENTYVYFDINYEKSKKHYTDDNQEIKQRANALKPSLENDTFLLEPYHAQNKYLKTAKNLPNGEKDALLNSYIDELFYIKNKLKPENTFDKIAVNSTINLLQNTRIWIELSIEEESCYHTIIEEFKSSNESNFLRNYFQKLVNKSVPKSFVDYHGHQRFLEFLDRFITYLRDAPFALIEQDALDRNSEGEKITQIKSKVDFIKNIYIETYRQFKDNLKVYNYRKYKPVYLTRDECSWKKPDPDSAIVINLFLDSSYILPDDYDRISEIWYGRENYLQANIRSLKNRIENEFHRFVTEKEVEKQTTEFSTMVTKTTKEFGEKTESFEKRVKDNEFKMVQIVAMFVTIATFVLINVKLFDNKSLIGGFSIMFGLASCLLLFNAFFNWLIIQRNEKEVTQESVTPPTTTTTPNIESDLLSWKSVWHNGLFRFIIILFGISVVLGFGDYIFTLKTLAKTEQKIKIDSTAIRGKIQSDSLHIQKRIEGNQKDIQKNDEFLKRRIELLENRVYNGKSGK